MSSLKERDLQRYFDGELRPARSRRVHDLIQQSEQHQQRLRALEQMSSLIREATSAETDRADLDRLWDRIEIGIAEQQPLSLAERYSFWLRRYGLALTAAALLLVAVAFALWPTSGPSPTPSTIAARNDCVIESLDVGPEAVSTIFTIEDAEESGDTTVIWVTETSAEGDMP